MKAFNEDGRDITISAFIRNHIFKHEYGGPIPPLEDKIAALTLFVAETIGAAINGKLDCEVVANAVGVSFPKIVDSDDPDNY